MGDKEEQLKLEFTALLEEFKTVRENILFDVGSNRQILALTLTSASILVAASPFIIESQFTTLFLIAPIIFYTLAWSQVRYLYLDATLSNYIIEILAPRFRKTLVALSPDTKKDFRSLLGWETYLQEREAKLSIVLLSISVARFGIPPLMALLSIAIYLIVNMQQPKQSLPSWDIILLIANTLLMSYTIYLGFWARFILPQKLGAKA